MTLVCGWSQTADTVVLADPNDPYYELADEIAQQGGAPLVHSREEAFAAEPVFLIWVVSPAHLTEQVLADYGVAAGERRSAVSLGLITGSTPEMARGLWMRAGEARAHRYSYADVRAEAISVPGSDNAEWLPLNSESMQRVIREADYLVYSGHGAPSSLMGLRSDEIPELGPIVVSTGSCQTLRPWLSSNIALAFVDRGAAAYAGFPSSPSGRQFLMGKADGMPFRYSWPDVPIGHVVQIEARAAMQTFARFPQYFLLGDPRISLAQEAPYKVEQDRTEGNHRTIDISGAPAGFLPIRVPGGAAFDYVSVSGITSASSRDPLFNSRLQMTNIGDDKYILLRQAGGDVQVELRQEPPWYWTPGDALVDLVDMGMISGPSDTQLAVGAGLLALVVTGWLAMRRRTPARTVALSGATGLTVSAAWLFYVYVRRESVTITSEAVALDPLSAVGSALLIGCGLLLNLTGRSRWVMVPALLVALFPGSLLVVILPPLTLVGEVIGDGPAYYSNVTIYAQLLRVTLTAVALALIFWFVRRQVTRREIPQA